MQRAQSIIDEAVQRETELAAQRAQLVRATRDALELAQAADMRRAHLERIFEALPEAVRAADGVTELEAQLKPLLPMLGRTAGFRT